MSILQNECTIWTQTKRIMKKLDRDCTRMLQVILNKSWKQHPTKQQQYGHLHRISRVIQVKQTRHAVHYWRNKDELSEVTFSYGPLHVDDPVLVDQQKLACRQLCADTGCSLEDLPGAMDHRDGWRERERVRKIRANGVTWWWWWW